MKFIKENLRVLIAVLVAIILIAAGSIMLLLKGEEPKKDDTNQKQREEEIIEVTGMSGMDAIEIVKRNFYSNNYEFFVEVTSDSLYKIRAVSKSDNTEIIYFVDPVNGKAYVDIDTN